MLTNILSCSLSSVSVLQRGCKCVMCLTQVDPGLRSGLQVSWEQKMKGYIPVNKLYFPFLTNHVPISHWVFLVTRRSCQLSALKQSHFMTVLPFFLSFWSIKPQSTQSFHASRFQSTPMYHAAFKIWRCTLSEVLPKSTTYPQGTRQPHVRGGNGSWGKTFDGSATMLQAALLKPTNLQLNIKTSTT